jgi:hypothetical protein
VAAATASADTTLQEPLTSERMSASLPTLRTSKG